MNSTGIEKIIVDVDVGLDDYVALLLLLQAQKLGQLIILAIVCTTANTKVDHVTKNVVRLLEIVNRTDIPVFRGTLNPFVRPDDETDAYTYFGIDGFSDLTYATEPDMSIVQSEPAAVGISRIINENPGQVTLITLAAMTNVALASKLNDNMAAQLKSVWTLGGQYLGRGNTVTGAEFNFYADPEAVHVFFDAFYNKTNTSVHFLPYETGHSSPLSREFLFDEFGVKTSSEIVHFMRAANKFYNELRPNEPFWFPFDAYLTAAYLNNSLILDSEKHGVSVELNGRLTRGRAVLDLISDPRGHISDADFITKFDVEGFKQMLLNL